MTDSTARAVAAGLGQEGADGGARVEPVSMAQRRLWFVTRLAPGDRAYHLCSALTVSAPVSPRRLQAAFTAIADRHASLRTTFTDRDGEPYQVVHPTHGLRVTVRDARHEPDEPSARERFVRAVAGEAFDLGEGPLVRVALRRGLATSTIAVVMHHLIADGESMEIFLDELRAFYAADPEDVERRMAPLEQQYFEHAAEVRASYGTEQSAADARYWRAVLAGLPSPGVPSLGPDRDAPTGGTVGVQRLGVRAAAWQALGELCRECGTTAFSGVLTLVAVLLSRLVESRDLAIGVPVSGRHWPGSEGLIGFFLNTLPIRITLRSGVTFRELLVSVRDTLWDAYEHQDLPFDRIVEAISAGRDPRADPIFNVVVNYAHGGDEKFDLAGLPARHEAEPVLGSPYWLSVYGDEHDDGLDLAFVHRLDIVGAAAARCAVESFDALIDAAVRSPDQALSALASISPRARRVLPDPRRPLPAPEQQPIAAAVRDAVDEHPDEPAVCRGSVSWTYRDLGLRMDEYRDAIERRPAGNRVVAVGGARGFDLAAAALAVMEAHRIVFLVDPALPEGRRERLLRLAGAADQIWIEDDQVGVAPCTPGAETAPGRAHPDPDAAYIVFTSGSTGQPKAILGSGRGLSHFVAWQRDRFGVGPGDRVAHLTALSFDVVLREMLLPLTSGATLSLGSLPGDAAPGAVLGWLARDRTTIVHTVPALATAWLRAAAPGAEIADLRLTFFAGEPLSDRLVADWRRVATASEVVNLYGPSETTLAKAWHMVDDPGCPGQQPVGWPLPDTQLIVLDEDGRLCAPFEPGEVVIRTPFASRGYLPIGDSEPGGFCSNPFTTVASDTAYRSGDRGRYREDGSLELLGRMDNQVKVRGARVDLAEVEGQLRSHPGVAQGTVVDRVGADGLIELAGYYVAHAAEAASHAALRRHLSQALPSYMVPARLERLERLPLTASGKVDRQALRQRPAAAPQAEAEGQPLVSPTEHAVAAIWGTLLGREDIRADSDFFELGGHSLLALQVVHRVKQSLDADVDLRAVLEFPRLAEFSERIDQTAAAAARAASDADDIIVALRATAGARRRLFVAHDGAGSLAGYLGLAGLLPDDVDVLGVAPAEEPGTSVPELADQYAQAIRRADPCGPYSLAGYSFGGILAYEIAGKLQQRGGAVELVVLLDAPAPSPEHRRTAATRLALIRRIEVGATDLDPAHHDAAARRRTLTNALERLGATHLASASASVLARFTTITAATATAGLTYEPAAYPGVLHVLATATGSGAAQRWRRIAPRAIVHRIPGTHDSIVTEPDVHAVAVIMRELLSTRTNC